MNNTTFRQRTEPLFRLAKSSSKGYHFETAFSIYFTKFIMLNKSSLYDMLRKEKEDVYESGNWQKNSSIPPQT